MGVHGLKHFIHWHRSSCLEDRNLSDCAVLVDGNNLAYLLYKKAPGISSAFGGDYDKFAVHVAFFVARLQQCNIRATVLMDGGQPQNNLKLHTSTTRLQSTMNTCLYYTPGYSTSRVFPLHARGVFVSVMKRMGVPVFQCDFEADGDLAFLARRCEAKVISNDSDFFLYDVDFVMLDSLKYKKVKRIMGVDGLIRNTLPCKMFRRNMFLKLCDLQPRQLGLLGCLSGNDCSPVSLLKEFHQYLAGGRKKKFGHTKRQNLLQFVINFLAKNKRSTNDDLLKLVVERVCPDVRPKLLPLLRLVASSYHPTDSKLLYCLQFQHQKQRVQEKQKQILEDEQEQHLQQKRNQRQLEEGQNQLQQKEHHGRHHIEKEQEETQQKELQVEQQQLENKMLTQQYSELIEGETNDNINLELISVDANIDSGLMCNCEKRWQGVLIDSVDDDFILKNAASSLHYDTASDDDDDDAQSVASDDSDGEEAENNGVEDCDANDERHNAPGPCDDDDKCNVVNGNGTFGNDDKELLTLGTDISASIVEKDGETAGSYGEQQQQQTEITQENNAIAPPKDLQNMSKKQRKKEMERLKHLERISKTYNKKLENLEFNKIQREKLNKGPFNITGLDMNQVMRLVDLHERGLLDDDGQEFETIAEDESSLIDEKFHEHSEGQVNEYQTGAETDSSELNYDGNYIKKGKNNENSSSDFVSLDRCPHSLSNLVTKSGYRLPDWLVYGFRHNIVGREVSDIVTNNFCISPPQMEDLDQDSCYRLVESVVKMIVVMVRGGGSDVLEKLNTEELRKERLYEESEDVNKGHQKEIERQRSTEKTTDYQIEMTARKNKIDCLLKGSKFDAEKNNFSESSSLNAGLKKKQRRRKNNDDLRWFIRDGKNLFVEYICLEEIYNEYSHIPSLTCIEKLSVIDRKMAYMDLLFKKEVGSVLLNLPDEFQLLLSFTCYWYKSSLSDVDGNHLMALLVTMLMFYIVQGKVGLESSADATGVCCLHCIVKASTEYKAERSIKSMVDKMICNKDSFNSKNRYKGRRVPAKSPNNKGGKMKSKVEEPCDCENNIDPHDNSRKGELHDVSLIIEDILSSVSELECSSFNEKLSSFHSPVDIDNSNYDRLFVHSMSEYQACVHYLNLLNGLFLTAFPPVCMEKIWSGTFCYNVYRTLLQYQDKSIHVVAILLGAQSQLYKLFIVLLKFMVRALKLDVNIPDLSELDQKAVIGEFVGGHCKPKEIKNQKVKVVDENIVVSRDMDVDDEYDLVKLATKVNL